MENMTLSSYWARFKDNYIGEGYSTQTEKGRVFCYENVISEYLGRKLIFSMTKDDVVACLESKKSEYSQNTIYGAYALLSRIFNDIEKQTGHPSPVKGLAGRYPPNRRKN